MASGAGYVVVSAPPGAIVHAVPAATTIVYVGATPYYYVGGTYYVATDAPAPQPPPPSQPAETTVNVNVNVQGASTGQEGAAAGEEPEMITEDFNFEVISPPQGATVPYLPEEAKETTIDGKKYYIYDETYYRPFVSEGDIIYMVVEDPRSATGP